MISRKERYNSIKRRKQKRIKRILLSAVSVIIIASVSWFLINGMDWRPNEDETRSAGHEAGNNGDGDRSQTAEGDRQPDRQSGPGDDGPPEQGEQPTEDPVVVPDPPGQGEDGTVTFAFAGDLMMATTVAQLVKDKGYDYPFQYVKEYLQQPDLTAVNLETPITERGEPQDKQWVYRTSPDALPALKEAGIDVVNIANNHILDYGEIGLLDTLDHLSDAELSYIGGGRDEEEAFRPAVFERNGVTVAFLGFSMVVPDGSWKAAEDHPGVAPTYDYRKPVAAIEAAREQADLVVVIAHWGKEREPLPEERQIEMAHRYIDAGADLVVGSHPHVLQGAEYYNGKWILYSLGNFIFTTNDKHPATWDSAILQAECSKNGDCGLSVVPINNKWALPRPLEGAEKERVLSHLDSISIHARVDAEGNISPAD